MNLRGVLYYFEIYLTNILVGWIRIRMDPAFAWIRIRIWNSENSKLDPDPEKIIPDPQHWF